MDLGNRLCCYGVPALYVALPLLPGMFFRQVAAATAESQIWDEAAFIRGQQACLVCPEANEKECKNCKLIKKAETKNHHQIILGNHEFSGKRLEEKSEKRKKVSSKVRERVSKVEILSNHKIESGKGEGSGKT